MHLQRVLQLEIGWVSLWESDSVTRSEIDWECVWVHLRRVLPQEIGWVPLWESDSVTRSEIDLVAL